ncbi:uncharacterized protein [Ptychodera flava]|uniref:uncharacterized protein isoform X2 n=1 Tax=Ptychodera flava TaxID=63121 RepID=UPI00396A790C
MRTSEGDPRHDYIQYRIAWLLYIFVVSKAAFQAPLSTFMLDEPDRCTMRRNKRSQDRNSSSAGQEQLSRSSTSSPSQGTTRRLNGTENVGASRTQVSQKSGFCSRCISVGKYVVLIMVLPAFLNQASLYKEAEVLRPPGKLYDIGGQKLYMNCVGKGDPTVIMDAPTGMTSDVWILVQEQLARLTKVCVYDRAGLGFSEAPSKYPNLSDSSGDGISEEKEISYMQSRWHIFARERMVDDLRRLVSHGEAKLRPPYILVGSELGALNVRFYTQLYESDVSDVVLIDPITEGLFEVDDSIWNQYWFGHLVPSLEALHLSAIVGLSRIALLLKFMHQPLTGTNVPDDVITRQKYLLCSGSHLSSVVDEHYFVNESISQMRTLWRLKPFPSNISVTVLTGNYYDEQIPSNLNTAWAKSVQHLISTVHPGCKHIVVNGADRHMIYRNPDAVVDPIKRLVRTWRGRHGNSHKQ